ncbi:preprotein translocase subunit SecA [Candidatus Nesciobacter abundans]|uniref:Protein translocase subunit SecA n=1 Tax=Candidatus Nesciobacter abundans TaxID=2601668 RepID=A0A5C0UIC0_9PROT|nr:preprotein translocase subunit SecA [Candidatus Nesciobacter abundans]QEK39253.1 preprotein translocase subunit SecA [Candidatus Nesciobacter abundans]
MFSFVKIVKKIINWVSRVLYRIVFWFRSNEIDNLKSIAKEIDKKNYSDLSDEELALKTQEFKSRFENGESLDSLLVEAFAVSREASKRVLNERPYFVQLLGGIALHKGMIAEMKTGEGKTLVAVAPAYLNALAGKGVHVITVNDYLAERDSTWMGKVFNFLGMSVGCIHNNMRDEERKVAYNCDITYGTNNEFAFDYLKNNMKMSEEEIYQRDLNCAIVDEIDNILIDEARTPLIISGSSNHSSDLYAWINTLTKNLNESDYQKDEKHGTCHLTSDGVKKIEKMLTDDGVIDSGDTMFESRNATLIHHLNQSMKAHFLFKKDKDYMVKDGQVFIIDEFTGRIMSGRRYSDGLHQALEAKENVKIQDETRTQASITFQRFFRLYNKLSGMTGTAMTEAEEFDKVYDLKIVSIPTNKPISRTDLPDEIHATLSEKIKAVISLVKKCSEKKQPVLIGTSSVEKSMIFSNALREEKIAHKVLNAKNHANEARIIADAGKLGSVTVVTNMAGRGTDIMLGGNAKIIVSEKIKDLENESEIDSITKQTIQEIKEEKEKVKNTGGLFVIGTERHESRRIDNQLRGRAGRQGDPGKSKFFLSLEDDLVRIYAGKVNTLSSRMKSEGPITGRIVTRLIAKVQKNIESHNFDLRQHVKKYSDVQEEQMDSIYRYRMELLKNYSKNIWLDLVKNSIEKMIHDFLLKDEDLSALSKAIKDHFKLDINFDEIESNEITEEFLVDYIFTKVEKSFEDYISEDEKILKMSKIIALTILDEHWIDHVEKLNYIKQGIGLRAYGQKDPLVEYKKEGIHAFEEMLGNFYLDSVKAFFHELSA